METYVGWRDRGENYAPLKLYYEAYLDFYLPLTPIWQQTDLSSLTGAEEGLTVVFCVY